MMSYAYVLDRLGQPSWMWMTTSAAILNSLKPNSQSERELGAEVMHTTTDFICFSSS